MSEQNEFIDMTEYNENLKDCFKPKKKRVKKLEKKFY